MKSDLHERAAGPVAQQIKRKEAALSKNTIPNKAGVRMPYCGLHANETSAPLLALWLRMLALA
jgi:hypothetical protein